MMVKGMHHFALIASSEASVAFYERLGFRVFLRKERRYDTVVLMRGHGIQIEMFIDPSHPERATAPENLGLRHLALCVDDVEAMTKEFECGPVMKDWVGAKFCFTADPDGLPVEFHE